MAVKRDQEYKRGKKARHQAQPSPHQKNKTKRKKHPTHQFCTKSQAQLPIMVEFSYKKQRLQVVKSRSLIYRTIATTPAAKARPPNPAPTTAAPPVEAAGLLEALLEAEDAELAADFVAVLMELAALETALDMEPVAELCLLEAAEEAEDYGGSQIKWYV
jgi:hypothetical protein